MEKRVINFRAINFFGYFFSFLLVWALSLTFPIVMPIFGVLYLAIGFVTRKNAKLRNFAVLSIINGTALITLAFMIYTIFFTIKVK